MEDRDGVLCALAEYVKNEQDGYQFYDYAARRTGDERGREMFASLANDELRHIAGLLAQHEAIARGEAWLTVQQFGACAIPPTGGMFPTDRAHMDELIEGAKSDLDALRIAIEMEKESYSAYKAEAEKARSADAREIFDALADEEHSHLETLENTYAFLANTGEWFQVKEKPIFEG